MQQPTCKMERIARKEYPEPTGRVLDVAEWACVALIVAGLAFSALMAWDCAKIHDNGKLVVKCVVYRGKSMAERVAHGAFKSYVRNLGGSNRFSGRGGFLKQAAFRRSAILTPAEELAETVRRQKEGDGK